MGSHYTLAAQYTGGAVVEACMKSQKSWSNPARFVQWLALVALLALLAACGSPELQSPNPDAATGTLEVVLVGVDSAQVRVSDAEGTLVYSDRVDGRTSMQVAAGTYTVDGGPAPQTLDPTAMQVRVKAASTTVAELVYREVSTGPSAMVADLDIVRVADELDSELPYVHEVNANKDVKLYAAQTEESVCVRVRALDAMGDPVANAHISVEVAENFGLGGDTVAVIRGCAQNSTGDNGDDGNGNGDGDGDDENGLRVAGVNDAVVTDDDGYAVFTLYATGDLPLELVFQELLTFAKVVVSASNDDGTAVLVEFKVGFIPISHLWAQFHDEEPINTGQRVGARFERTNLFDANDRRHYNGDDGDAEHRNAFPIQTSLFYKQPQLPLDIGEVGFIRYTVVGEHDSDGEPADVVHLEGCDSGPWIDEETGYEYCDDTDGLVYLVPNDGVRLEDTPFNGHVKAVLWVGGTFGETEYWFPLKDYKVHKEWIGSFLRIRKHVDHHVLTWAGSDFVEYLGVQNHTLDPANAVKADSPYTATVTLKVANEGNDTVYDITIADLLPAELGVIEETIDPSGGTYDSVQHAVTWNWRQNEDQVAGFTSLAPGETLEVSFQVYVRQKPGFCVDFEDYAISEFYANEWTWAASHDDLPCYDDPYEIINGAELHDVTASWFSSAPHDEGGHQSVTDFNGWVYEDDAIIHAVRPLFHIDKQLANYWDLPFEVGMDGLFDITLLNIARDEVEPAYMALAEKYPEEFDGSVRDNPIGYHVQVYDIFLIGLDFDDASLMKLTDDEGVRPDEYFDAHFVGAPPAPFLDLGDKAVVWDPIPHMGGGDTATARLTLDHDLPGYHINIAAALGNNLNQFELGDCLDGENGIANDSDVPLTAVPDLPDPFTLRLVADCALTFALAPTDPWLELDSLGTNDTVILNDEQSVTFHDTVQRGDAFPWVFSVLNGGSGAAEHTTIHIELDGTDKAHITDAELVVFDTAGALVATFAPSSIADGEVMFGPYDHPPGFIAYAVVFAQSKKVGNVSATATVDYHADSTETQYPLLPLQMDEIVSIQPPR